MQKEIIKRMKVSPMIDPEEEIRRSINFMKAYIKKQPFLESFVLGISGGQDSTLLGKLAQMAVEELREEMQSDKPIFIAVRLPYGKQIDEDEAMQAIEWIKPDRTFRVNIKGQVDSLVRVLEDQGLPINDFNKGNIKARERMVAQYAIAGEFNGVVLGSDHSAENVTGFFTKHGDGASDLNPLFRLNKRQGRQLLEYLNAPEKLYNKIPTVDLEYYKVGLSDDDI